MNTIQKFKQSRKNIPKLQTAWTPITKRQKSLDEWADEWKFRTTPASRSKVVGGWSSKGDKKDGVETDKQYTERRKKEATQRTWRSDAADIAHGVMEGALAMHPYTAIPYYGAKVGQDFFNGTYGWQTALNASVPLFHLNPQINSTIDNVLVPKINKMMQSKGYAGSATTSFTNGKHTISDMSPYNIGYDKNGNLRFFDFYVE